MAERRPYDGIPARVPVTVGTASAIAVAPERRRKRLILTNDGTVPIYLGTEIAYVNAGLPIYPRGFLILQPDNVGRIYTGPIAAISGTAGQNLCVVEEI